MVFDPKKQLPTGPQSANEALLDSLIRHQIYLLRFSGGLRNDTLKILDATEKDIVKEIRRRLKNTRNLATPAGVKRLKALKKVIKKIRTEAWKEVRTTWSKELKELAKAEALFLSGAVTATSVVAVDVVLPPVSILNSIVTSRPFEGKVLSEWAKSIERSDVARINDQIQIGVTQGQTTTQIARRVVGTVGQRGVNGVTEITRRNAQTITRTAVNAITNQAKRELYELNTDIMDQELYVATLDSRTTPICRSLDGKKYSIGEGPLPPLHMGCRSLRVPVFDDVALGNRPAVASTQKQLLREYTNDNGLKLVRSRNDLPRGTKGAFDKFARTRKRELTGTVTGKTTYQQWLGRQPAAIQDDILGKSKGALFRRGKLSLDRFVDRQGSELTLKQLVSSDRDAFIKANLDPEDFL